MRGHIDGAASSRMICDDREDGSQHSMHRAGVIAGTSNIVREKNRNERQKVRHEGEELGIVKLLSFLKASNLMEPVFHDIPVFSGLTKYTVRNRITQND